MLTILVLGCGRSSPVLLKYLSKHSAELGLHLIAADKFIADHFCQYKNVEFHEVDLNNEIIRQSLISRSNIVISLLPPSMHLTVIHDCLAYGKHLLTASYVTPEISALDRAARETGITIMMECGLDPGIDHMSALHQTEIIKNMGGVVKAFRSYTGGLPAPESCDGLWNYKITWNPKNVVLAGKGVNCFLFNKLKKYISYNRLFKTIYPVFVEGVGSLEAYPNRDSLSYIKRYGLECCESFLRGTLRYKGYCEAWDVLVQLGYTDDSYNIEQLDCLSWFQLFCSFLPDYKKNFSLAENISRAIGYPISASTIRKLESLGLFENTLIPYSSASPAFILQKCIEEKWKMLPNDKDIIVMQHEIEYEKENEKRKRTCELVVKGENSVNTAMATTVGLPLGIIALMLCKRKISTKGVVLPLTNDIYVQVLNELETQGISFKINDHDCTALEEDIRFY